MDPKTTVQTLLDAVQKGDFEKAKSLLSADFKFSGPVPEPINGEAWLGMSKSLKRAFPDINYHFKVESVTGDIVNVSAKLQGTHHGDFDLTNMHMGVIPATNKSFAAAQEHGKVTVKGDKVTAWANNSTEGAGLNAILGQLGVKVPTI